MYRMLVSLLTGACAVSLALADLPYADSAPGPLDSVDPGFALALLPQGDLAVPAELQASWVVLDDHPGHTTLAWTLEDSREVLLADDLPFQDGVVWFGTEPGLYTVRLTARDAFGNMAESTSQLRLTQTVDGLDRPATFALQPAQPNPFNPTTTLRFSLPATAQARMSVYNLRGEQVATLLNGRVAGGAHELRVDAGAWTSGLYLALLESEGRSAVQKLLLVK
jgi:hypothetical protein